MKQLEDLKVALVCDWLTGTGGAERVVLELHKLFPQTPIYTSQYDPTQIDWFKDADVRTLWIQKLPSGLKKFLPVLRARAFSRLDLSNYDLVISAGGAEAKAVKTGNATHINYCYAPTHYYWSRYEAYLKQPGFGAFNWLARLGLKLLAGPMRRWDYKAAQKPDHLIAISTHIQAEIKKYYGRDAEVVHPPVDINRFDALPQTNRQGFVVTGRQTPYKRIDLAVEACTQLNLPLVVLGNGPEHRRLQALAGSTVQFITNATDDEVAKQLSAAEGFIFAGLDDFGIAPVEAMAAGTPVIAYKAGGALDYVKEGVSGVFFTDQTLDSLMTTLKHFNAKDFQEDKIKDVAKEFSNENFITNMKKTIARLVQT